MFHLCRLNFTRTLNLLPGFFAETKNSLGSVLLLLLFNLLPDKKDFVHLSRPRRRSLEVWGSLLDLSGVWRGRRRVRVPRWSPRARTGDPRSMGMGNPFGNTSFWENVSCPLDRRGPGQGVGTGVQIIGGCRTSPNSVGFTQPLPDFVSG